MLTFECCIDCTDRHRACHDTCERYSKIKAENEKIRKDIIDENILVSYGEDKRKALRKYTKYKHLSLK